MREWRKESVGRGGRELRERSKEILRSRAGRRVGEGNQRGEDLEGEGELKETEKRGHKRALGEGKEKLGKAAGRIEGKKRRKRGKKGVGSVKKGEKSPVRGESKTRKRRKGESGKDYRRGRKGRKCWEREKE